MKNPIRFLAIALMVGGVYAQSNVPICVSPSLSLAKISANYTDLNNCTNNQGTMIYPSGEQYSGQWKNGKRDGFGTTYYPNGKIKFSGEFKNDEINGRGTEYSLNGSIKSDGIWINGKFINTQHPQQFEKIRLISPKFLDGLLILWLICSYAYQLTSKENIHITNSGRKVLSIGFIFMLLAYWLVGIFVYIAIGKLLVW